MKKGTPAKEIPFVTGNGNASNCRSLQITDGQGLGVNSQE